MNCPKIKTATALDNLTLLVEFDNAERKQYDVSPLLLREMFLPLEDPVLFKAVKVELGGYAVVWNEDIDISEHELWKNGVTCVDSEIRAK